SHDPPAKVGTTPVTPFEVSGSRAVGNRAGAQGERGVLILNFTDPRSPKAIGSLFMSTPSTARLTGNYILAAADYYGLEVYDASQAGGPYKTLDFQGSRPLAETMAVLSSPQYLFSASGAVDIFQLSAGPPALVGSYSSPDPSQYPTALELVGNTLFVGMDQSLIALDLSNPSKPIQLASMKLLTT